VALSVQVFYAGEVIDDVRHNRAQADQQDGKTDQSGGDESACSDRAEKEAGTGFNYSRE
jgi:hypothetical protein